MPPMPMHNVQQEATQSLQNGLFGIITLIIFIGVMVMLCNDATEALPNNRYVQDLRRGSCEGLLSLILSPRRSYGTLGYSRPVDPRRLRKALSKLSRKSSSTKTSRNMPSTDSSPFITNPPSLTGSLRSISPRPDLDDFFDEVSTPDLMDIRSTAEVSDSSSTQASLRAISPRPVSYLFFEGVSTPHVLEIRSLKRSSTSRSPITPSSESTGTFRFGKPALALEPLSQRRKDTKLSIETKAAKALQPDDMLGEQTEVAWPFQTIDLGYTQMSPFDASTCYQVLQDADFSLAIGVRRARCRGRSARSVCGQETQSVG